MKRTNNFENSFAADAGTYKFYRERMVDLALSCFRWDGLPDTINVRALEETLFLRGTCAVVEDPVIGLLALPWQPAGTRMDCYGDPIDITAQSRYNNYRTTADRDHCVIVYNNLMRRPSFPGADYYARELWELDRIRDINAAAQKTPILITGSEKDRVALKNVYKSYDGNAPVVYASNNLDLGSLGVLQTGAPYVADKIQDLKNKIWDEALSYLGISNVSVEKKAQLITDEVQRSQGGTVASRYSRLTARKEAAEKINELWGLSVTVDYREDVEPGGDPAEQNEEEENGEIYG